MLPTRNGKRPRELAAQGLSAEVEMDEDDLEQFKGYPDCVAVFDVSGSLYVRNDMRLSGDTVHMLRLLSW
jgi:hypothetical protein